MYSFTPREAETEGCYQPLKFHSIHAIIDSSYSARSRWQPYKSGDKVAIQVVNLLDNYKAPLLVVFLSESAARPQKQSREANKLDPSFFMQAVTSQSANFTPIASLRDHWYLH